MEPNIIEKQEEQPQNHQKPVFITKDFSYISKLKELLRNLNSPELQLCSDASKQFIKLIKSDAGPDILTEYLQTSSKCIELSQAWEVRKSKPGFLDIVKLIIVLLGHEFGRKGGIFGGILDDFARGIVEERMEDLILELGSKEGKRQKAVLFLLAAVVRRRLGLGWEVMKRFDFKNVGFVKLGDWKGRKVEGKRQHMSTRKAFVEFAMSFVEVANPRLLREILQQRGMYSGVLRGIGDDDEEVVIHVLSILREKVLVKESLVPPGLRSVLFGIVTLEQLVSISGRGDGGMVAGVAHDVLISVCTDPANGLMPDLDRKPSPLRGNPKRLFDLMKKLKATEFENHKELLLALVKGRPSFGSSYLNEFPYYIDDLTRPNWFASISLAAKVISSVADGLTFGFLNSSTQEVPDIDSPDVQSIIKCIGPRALTREIIYKGLRHADPLVTHATLKLVSEALKLLASFFGALKDASSSSNRMDDRWETLMRDVENELRMSLPFPGELFSLLSPLYKSPKSCQKRPATEAVLEHSPKDRKKLKTSDANEDLDIIIGGISSTNDMTLSEDGEQDPEDHDMDQEDDDANLMKLIGEIWEINGDTLQTIVHCDEDAFFYSKVLDALKIYQHTMVNEIDGSLDYFKVVTDDILYLPEILQRSLLSLLVQHVGWSSHGKSTSRAPAEIYKHLRKFIKLLLGSSSRDIKDYAYILAKEAMLSTGAFDRNPQEISAWLLLIPGYGRECIAGDQGIASIEELSSVIVSFLCDAVSIIAKNLCSYLKDLRHYMDVKGARGQCPRFGPFFICVLHQCTELLSRSGKKTLPKKTIISVYVCSALKYFLETQAEAQLLSSLIDYDLSEIRKFDISGETGDLCEWRPMKTLLLFSRNIVHQVELALSSNVQKERCSGGSFANILDEVKGSLQNKQDDDLVGVTTGLSYSILCTNPQELCQNFPLLVSISAKLFGVPLSLLSSIFFLEPNLLSSVSRLWPKVFVPGLEMFIAAIQGEERDNDRVGCLDVDSMQAASLAFSFFLKGAPFHVLFPFGLLDGSLPTLDLPIHKIPFTLPDEFASTLSRVLFWLNQAIVSYRIKPHQGVEIFSENCIHLIERMLNKVFVDKLGSDSSSDAWVLLTSQCVTEIAELVFCHPAVVLTLEFPIPGEDLEDAILWESLENFPETNKQGVQKIDFLVLNLVRTTCELMSSFFDSQGSIPWVNHAVKRVVKVFNGLKTKVLVILKDGFNRCVKSGDFVPLVPIFTAVHLLIRYISPFELLETVHSLISEIDLTTETLSPYFSLSALLHLAACAFDTILDYLRESYLEKQRYHLLWGMERTISLPIFEKVFFWICEVASRFELDLADRCLQKALMVAKAHLALQNDVTQAMTVSRVVACTPINMLFHCMKKVTKIKSLLLLSLTDLSSLHLSVFGCLFGSMINRSSFTSADLTGKESGCHLSDEELVLLLPTALLYLNSSATRYEGMHSENKEYIPSIYWRILSQGFSDWKTYASRGIFEVGPGEPWPASLEQFLSIVSASLLGKSARMLRHYIHSSGDPLKMETRMSLFNSLHLQTDDDISLLEKSSLSDCKSNQFGDFSLVQCLNIANRVAAKIYISSILLFPETSNCKPLQHEELDGLEEGCSDALDSLRMEFLNKLVNLWELVVKSFPSTVLDRRQIENKICSLFRYLEQFIRHNILDLMELMNVCLIRQPYPRFVKKLVKTSISQRFEDADTLKMVQSVLSLVFYGNFSSVSVLRKILDRSQFLLTSLSVNNSMPASLGMIFTPMHSIIRSLSISYAPLLSLAKEKKLNESECMKQLEVVKLLRVVLRVSAQERKINSVEGTEINLRELVCLLLSSYGATMGKLDVEIFSLINEIELFDQQSSDFLVEMDYLWGRASYNLRNVGKQELDGSYGGLSQTEASIEQRKIQFRENFPVDPKMCAATVVNFPYNRTINDVSPDMFEKEFEDVVKENDAEDVRIRIYDPVYILRFSVHCLSLGYVEPLEFANSGLLAIAIVSLSSPNDDLRKLGYQAIGKFKSEVERSPKGSAIKRLKLLLLYLQNSIEQLGQRISSPVAVFLAESTLVLLNSSHVYHATVIKFLMLHPKANMQTVPLFESFFSDSESSSADKAWMLYLLHAGLNTDEDAKIYMRNSIIEILLSFYLSPVCDDKSKELILQVLKKSVRLPKVALSLVKDCGLIPWLSAIISSEASGGLLLTQIAVVLEVLNEIISEGDTFKWLQKSAKEQISELATHLFELLVVRTEMIKEHNIVVRRCIHVLVSAVRISQKYKVRKPHLTLSAEGLVRLCEAVDACTHERSDSTAELGLKVLLMSTPPSDILHVAPEKLLKLVNWAISVALKAKSEKVPPENLYCQLPLSSEGNSDDSLAIKLLRWLTASAILTTLSRRFHNLNPSSFLDKSNSVSLQSLLEWHQSEPAENLTEYRNQELLAASLICLQQLLDVNCKLLSSVVFALCLLLVKDSSSTGEDCFSGGVDSFASLCSNISFPAEADPSWRWSFHQKRTSISSQPLNVEKVQEIRACKILLVRFSNMLAKKSSSRLISLEDVEKHFASGGERCTL